MFSESRNDRHHRPPIASGIVTMPQGSRQRRRDRENAAGIAKMPQGLAVTLQGLAVTLQGSVITLQKSAAGIVNIAAGIVNIAAKVVPCLTLS